MTKSRPAIRRSSPDSDGGQTPQFLHFEAAADLEWGEIQAAEDGKPKPPSFSMNAYNGGAMRVGGFFRPVVVDLTGMKVAAKQIAILRDHDPDRIIGHGQPEISPQGIKASGLVSAENEHAREVIASSRNGFPWQASIGARVLEIESIREGEKVTVNGQTIRGPVLVARKTELYEISFLPFGADKRTSARVAAGDAGENRPARQPGISLNTGRRGLWIKGSGTAFVSLAELDRLVKRIRGN